MNREKETMEVARDAVAAELDAGALRLSTKTIDIRGGWHITSKSYADGQPPHIEPGQSRVRIDVIWADVDRTKPIAANDYDGCWAVAYNPLAALDLAAAREPVAPAEDWSEFLDHPLAQPPAPVSAEAAWEALLVDAAEPNISVGEYRRRFALHRPAIEAAIRGTTPLDAER